MFSTKNVFLCQFLFIYTMKIFVKLENTSMYCHSGTLQNTFKAELQSTVLRESSQVSICHMFTGAELGNIVGLLQFPTTYLKPFS